MGQLTGNHMVVQFSATSFGRKQKVSLVYIKPMNSDLKSTITSEGANQNFSEERNNSEATKRCLAFSNQ